MFCKMYGTVKIKDIFTLTAYFLALFLLVLGRKCKTEDIIQDRRKRKLDLGIKFSN